MRIHRGEMKYLPPAVTSMPAVRVIENLGPASAGSGNEPTKDGPGAPLGKGTMIPVGRVR